MRVLPLLLALAGTASLALAQPNCNTQTGSSRSLATNAPFGGNSLFGHPGYPGQVTTPYSGFAFLIDVTTAVPITIDRIDLDLFGAGGAVNTGSGTFLHPSQVGNTTLVDVYTAPNTWVGNETIPPNAPGSPWTLVGTAELTVAGSHQDSIIDFNTVFPGSSGPISLMPGTVGMAIQVHPVPSPTGPSGQPNTLVWNPMEPTTPWVAPWPLHPMLDPGITAPPSYTDSILTLASVQFQRNAFASGPSPQTLTQNIEFHYIPGAGSANWTSWGTGCETVPANWYENWTGPVSTFDLMNGVNVTKLPNGRHLVTPVSGETYIAPTSAPLTVATGNVDDGITAPITLPWTFNFPGGGSTNDIIVCTNGFIFLNGTATRYFPWYDRFASEFRLPEARVCPAWTDLDTTNSGTMHYEVDPNTPPTWVRITWKDIEEWSPTVTPAPQMTFQLVLHQNGDMDFLYQTPITTSNAFTNSLLVGFTPGGEMETASRDISAAAFASGDGTTPPVLGLSARPIIGTTFNLDTTNIKQGTLFNVVALGFVNNPAGMSLGTFNLPNCNLYLQIGTPITTVFNGVTGTTSSRPLTIPPSPAFNGVNLFGQAAPLTPGYNGPGVFLTNGICIALGLF